MVISIINGRDAILYYSIGITCITTIFVLRKYEILGFLLFGVLVMCAYLIIYNEDMQIIVGRIPDGTYN